MLGRSCQSVRFRHADRQNPTQLSFLQGDENVHFIGGFASSRGLVVASPPRRRGPQVRAPWRHGGHGAVDTVGPVVPPGRARVRGDAGVYTNRQKCSPTCFIVAGCRASSHAWDGLGPARPGAGGRRPPYAAGRGGSTPGSSRRPGPSWRRTRGASTSTRTRPRMPAASPSTGRGRSRWPMT